MRLDEIYLRESDTDMLVELLESYNKGLPNESRKTFQEYAEELLSDAIYIKWRRMKDEKH